MRRVAQIDHRVRDVRMAGGGGLDFAGFDPVAAQLDLAVAAPQIGEPHSPAVEGGGDQVPGAVEPGAGVGGVGHEPGRGQARLGVVAAGQAGPGQIQLAHHPRRHRPQPRVEDQGGEPVHQRPDRHGHARIQVGDGGDVGGLGGAVPVAHRPPRRPPVHEICGHRLPTDTQHVEFGDRGRVQGRQHRGGDQRVRHPLLDEERGQFRAEQTGRGDHQVAAPESAETCSPTAMSKLIEVWCRNRVAAVIA